MEDAGFDARGSGVLHCPQHDIHMASKGTCREAWRTHQRAAQILSAASAAVRASRRDTPEPTAEPTKQGFAHKSTTAQRRASVESILSLPSVNSVFSVVQSSALLVAGFGLRPLPRDGPSACSLMWRAG
jgi:hypothetical protein